MYHQGAKLVLTAQIKSVSVYHLLCLSAALNDEDVSIDVLHTHPVGEGQSGIGPDPVHHGTQLHQKWNQPESYNIKKLYVYIYHSHTFLFLWLPTSQTTLRELDRHGDRLTLGRGRG